MQHKQKYWSKYLDFIIESKPNGKTIFIRRADLEEWISQTPILSNDEMKRRADYICSQLEKDRNKGGEK